MKRNCVLPLCLGALFACTPAKPQEKSQTSLEDLVRTSMDKNREVLALRQRVAQARGLARQAGVRPAPSIEAEGLSGRPLGSPGDQEFSAAFVKPLEALGSARIGYALLISRSAWPRSNSTSAAHRSRTRSRTATCR
jgi:cobalt-zinc-cadmium efflux system outer membrane protein